MSERSNPEQSRDDALLERELRQAELEDRIIPAHIARLIASRWHDGQASALYAFQSTGSISYEIADDLIYDYNNPSLSAADRRELDHLIKFINAQEVDEDGERGPQENWHLLTRWDFGDQEPLPEDGDA